MATKHLFQSETEAKRILSRLRNCLIFGDKFVLMCEILVDIWNSTHQCYTTLLLVTFLNHLINLKGEGDKVSNIVFLK